MRMSRTQSMGLAPLLGIPFVYWLGGGALATTGILGYHGINQATEPATGPDGNPRVNPNVQSITNALLIATLGLGALYIWNTTRSGK